MTGVQTCALPIFLSPLGGATAELLPSLKQRLVGGRRWHRRVPGPFRSAYGSGLPGSGRDGVGLSPVSVVSRCIQAMPPITLSVRRTDPSGVLRTAADASAAVRLRQARERGLPTRPKRDTSRTTLAWPLRQRPLPCVAGCIVSPWEIRARVSVQVRPCTGRIKWSGCGQTTAPFETEPSTPAAHKIGRAHV